MELDVLEQAYGFAKQIFSKGNDIEYEGVGSFKTKDPYYHMLGYLIDYYGYNGFPQPIADEEFEKLPEKGYYHGFDSIQNGKEFIDSFNYHYGSGKIIRGFYLTDIRTEAYKYVQDRLMENDSNLRYSDISLQTQQGLTAKFKLINVKGISQKKLQEWSNKFENFEEDTIEDVEVREKFKQLRNFLRRHTGEKMSSLFGNVLISSNLSALAVLLGYDYIIDDVGYVVVLNRGKMGVKQSDFIKFTTGAEQENNASQQNVMQ